MTLPMGKMWGQWRVQVKRGGGVGAFGVGGDVARPKSAARSARLRRRHHRARRSVPRSRPRRQRLLIYHQGFTQNIIIFKIVQKKGIR